MIKIQQRGAGERKGGVLGVEVKAGVVSLDIWNGCGVSKAGFRCSS